MNEMPLAIRRNQISFTYWTNLKGHRRVTPLVTAVSRVGKKTDEELWLDDGGCSKINRDMGFSVKPHCTVLHCPTMVIRGDRGRHTAVREEERKHINRNQVNRYMEEHY